MPYQVSDGPGSDDSVSVAERLGASAAGVAGHRTLAEKAFGMLHDAIVSGTLHPGERLPIEDLGGAMGMSPMPIREALRRLDGVGLVENIPHRGARVTELSIDDLKEVYDARLMLEIPAIQRAAENFSAEDRSAAEEWLDRLGSALDRGDRAEALKAHTGFHFALYRASSSRWLVRLIMPLWDSAERYRVVATGDQGGMLKTRMDEHHRLLAACSEHKSEVAGEELWNHLTWTANAIAQEMGGADLYAPKPVPA